MAKGKFIYLLNWVERGELSELADRRELCGTVGNWKSSGIKYRLKNFDN